MTLKMPETEPAPQQGLSLGAEQHQTHPQPSQLPLTNHKPLVPLLTTTELSKMPPTILRFHLRMMRYNPKVLHVPGKCQISLMYCHLLQPVPRIHLTYSSLKKLKSLLAPQWTIFVQLLSAFKRSYKLSEMMKYACKSEGIAKIVGQYTCPINPYSGHIGRAELT